jgi:transposase
MTFYHWKERFEQQGYAGLEQPHSHRPKKFARQKPQAIVDEVIAMRKDHPDWGKQRIAHEIAKAHNWVPVVSHNTVKRILSAAELWNTPSEGKKTKARR